MHLSVIIPSYQSQGVLPGTLRALQGQNTDLTYEVIVVDCSPGDEIQRICQDFPFVRFFHENARFNPGIGRNLGAARAQGALLLFLDSDVILAPDALQQAHRFYREGHQVFTGALELNEAHAEGPASYLEHYFFNHESQKGRRVFQRSNLSSALMAVDRRIFEKDGGFRDIPRMQDTEMTERLRAQGHRLWFCPDVIGLQIQDSPLGKVLRKIYINGKNLYFIRYEGRSRLFKTGFFVLLPAVASAKVARIIARHLRYQDARGRLITVLLTPLLVASGLYWLAGLYGSLICGGEISQRRD